MSRTIVSAGVLLGSLLLTSKLVYQSTALGDRAAWPVAQQAKVDESELAPTPDLTIAPPLLQAAGEAPGRAVPSAEGAQYRLARRPATGRAATRGRNAPPAIATRPVIVVDPRLFPPLEETLGEQHTTTESNQNASSEVANQPAPSERSPEGSEDAIPQREHLAPVVNATDLPQESLAQRETEPRAVDQAEPSDGAPILQAGPVTGNSSTDLQQGLAGEDQQTTESSEVASSEGTAIEPLEIEVEFGPEMLARHARIEECLDIYFEKRENTRRRSPWGLMHAMIAYGIDSEVEEGGPGGRRVNTIGWLCFNGASAGQRLFTMQNSQLVPRTGPGLQGHQGQFLAMLAQSRVRSEYPIRVGSTDFTVADLIEYEMRNCEPGSELTFKLISLVHYLESDATWTDRRGRTWDIERLIREELAQPVIGAACGGTHRMMGFSYAVKKREERGEPFEGQWLRAKEFVDAYLEYAFKLQNSDGSFSTNWFASRGASRSIDRRMQTTGHILEWLVYTLPEERLDDADVVLSVDYLTQLMMTNKNRDWEVGPRGHALHALALYDQRVFGTPLTGRSELVRRHNEENVVRSAP